MDPRLLAMLAQTITREPVTAPPASGSYGVEGFGTPVHGIKARVSAGRSRIRTPAGDEVVPDWEVVVDGGQAMALGDRITVPAGTKHTVVKLHEPPDETGVVHHKRFWLT